MTIKGIPQELAAMTPAQVEEVLAFYGGLGIAELRDRQNLVRAQQAKAFAMTDGYAKTRATSNLAVDEALLAEAVFRSTWPDERHAIDISRWRS
jgi:hypothetical protein